MLVYQGAEEDPEKLSLGDKLLDAVLAEAHVVCVGWAVGLLEAAWLADFIGAGGRMYFVNSSPAPVILFRRRVKSVADVLSGVRQYGFSHGRWERSAGEVEGCLFPGIVNVFPGVL